MGGLRLIYHIPFGCARSPVNLISVEFKTNNLLLINITEYP